MKTRRITLDFIVDDETTPTIFAQKVATVLAQNHTIKPGEKVAVANVPLEFCVFANSMVARVEGKTVQKWIKRVILGKDKFI